MWFDEMDDLGSGIKGIGTNTDLGIWLKLSIGSRVSFDSRVGSKLTNWNSHSLSKMWLSSIGGSFSRCIGTGINVGSGMWFKWGKNTEVNIDSKIRTKSQSWGSGHIHVQVQSHWSENLPVCQWFDIDQVQDIGMKLNFGFQTTIIFGPDQWG